MNNPIRLVDKDGNVVVDADGNPVQVEKTANGYKYTLAPGASEKAIKEFETKTKPVLEKLNNSKVGQKILEQLNDPNHQYNIVDTKKKGKENSQILDEESNAHGTIYQIEMNSGNHDNSNPNYNIEEWYIGTLTVEVGHVEEGTVGEKFNMENLNDTQKKEVYNTILNKSVENKTAYRDEKNIPKDKSLLYPVEDFNKAFPKSKIDYNDKNKQTANQINEKK